MATDVETETVLILSFLLLVRERVGLAGGTTRSFFLPREGSWRIIEARGGEVAAWT
jgi:hypothetical protein